MMELVLSTLRAVLRGSCSCQMLTILILPTTWTKEELLRLETSVLPSAQLPPSSSICSDARLDAHLESLLLFPSPKSSSSTEVQIRTLKSSRLVSASNAFLRKLQLKWCPTIKLKRFFFAVVRSTTTSQMRGRREALMTLQS